jgi:hypothetical protein
LPLTGDRKLTAPKQIKARTAQLEQKRARPVRKAQTSSTSLEIAAPCAPGDTLTLGGIDIISELLFRPEWPQQ